VVTLALKLVGEHFDLAAFHVGADYAPAAWPLLAPLTTHEPSLCIEAIAVRPAARLAKNRDLAIGCHFHDAIAGDVAEEDVAFGIDGRAFEETDHRAWNHFGIRCHELLWQADLCQVDRIGSSSKRW